MRGGAVRANRIIRRLWCLSITGDELVGTIRPNKPNLAQKLILDQFAELAVEKLMHPWPLGFPNVHGQFVPTLLPVSHLSLCLELPILVAHGAFPGYHSIGSYGIDQPNFTATNQPGHLKGLLSVLGLSSLTAFPTERGQPRPFLFSLAFWSMSRTNSLGGRRVTAASMGTQRPPRPHSTL